LEDVSVTAPEVKIPGFQLTPTAAWTRFRGNVGIRRMSASRRNCAIGAASTFQAHTRTRASLWTGG
jgi:hypothetical protein